MLLSPTLYLLIAGIAGTSLSLGLFLDHQTSKLAKGYQQIIAGNMADVESTRAIQLNLKNQVEEWKDLLLSGSDPAQSEKYSKAFIDEEMKVEDDSNALAKRVTDPEASALLQKFLEAHHF